MKKTLFLFQSEGEETPEVNLTPLIDVVFVILILFILVAPLVEVDQVQLAPGGGQKKEELVSHMQEKGIQIHVYKNNTIRLNGAPISVESLKGKLRVLRASDPSCSPQLFQDREAFFGTYQLVKNALEEAGFESLDLILEPG